MQVMRQFTMDVTRSPSLYMTGGEDVMIHTGSDDEPPPIEDHTTTVMPGISDDPNAPSPSSDPGGVLTNITAISQQQTAPGAGAPNSNVAAGALYTWLTGGSCKMHVFAQPVADFQASMNALHGQVLTKDGMYGPNTARYLRTYYPNVQDQCFTANPDAPPPTPSQPTPVRPPPSTPHPPPSTVIPPRPPWYKQAWAIIGGATLLSGVGYAVYEYYA